MTLSLANWNGFINEIVLSSTTRFVENVLCQTKNLQDD